MNPSFKLPVLLSVLLLLLSCKGDITHERGEIAGNEYAKFFELETNSQGDVTLVINESWSGKREVTRYRIIKADSNKEYTDETEVINVPLRKVVCMSTSHIAYINTLNEERSIAAISGGEYVSDSLISSMVNDGRIADIGFESSISYEKLMQLKPDIVFTYGISGENNLYIQKIRDLGIKVIALGDYMEEHPLGKLEYLKLFGELFCKREYADSLYRSIRERYFKVRERVADIDHRPFILLNAPWKETWYIPGENNYMSHLIRDAGGDVLLSKRGDSHSYPNSIEEVFANSGRASLWLNPNFYSSINELGSSNPLFLKMDLLKSGKVFNNTKRNTIRGGSDFWERGVVEPDIILNDLINIIHPERGDRKELRYYIKLE